jgi:hypothetical protein
MEPPDDDRFKSASSTWDILVWYFLGKTSPNVEKQISNWQKSSVLWILNNLLILKIPCGAKNIPEYFKDSFKIKFSFKSRFLKTSTFFQII